MKTTAIIFRYIMTLMFVALASYVTWVAVTARYFDWFMIPSVLLVWSTVIIYPIMLKDGEASL
jgi:hypothetical protein